MHVIGSAACRAVPHASVRSKTHAQGRLRRKMLETEWRPRSPEKKTILSERFGDKDRSHQTKGSHGPPEAERTTIRRSGTKAVISMKSDLNEWRPNRCARQLPRRARARTSWSTFLRGAGWLPADVFVACCEQEVISTSADASAWTAPDAHCVRVVEASNTTYCVMTLTADESLGRGQHAGDRVLQQPGAKSFAMPSTVDRESRQEHDWNRVPRCAILQAAGDLS